MTSDRDALMLERVRALLAKADSTEFPAEADTFRAKADELMTAYAIQQWQVDQAQEGVGARAKPEDRKFDLAWYQSHSRANELWHLMQITAKHCRVQLVYWRYDGHTIPAVALPSDLDYFDMLFTHLMLQMEKGLEPHPSRSKSMIENLVMMKEAGMKWERIGELLIQVDQLDHYNRNMGVKFTKLYTDYCTERKRPRLRTTPSVYQRSYALGFVHEIASRLSDQVEARGTGVELALRDISKDVEDEAHRLFGGPPNERGRKARMGKMDAGAYNQGRQDGSEASIAANAQRSRRDVAGELTS